MVLLALPRWLDDAPLPSLASDGDNEVCYSDWKILLRPLRQCSGRSGAVLCGRCGGISASDTSTICSGIMAECDKQSWHKL